MEKEKTDIKKTEGAQNIFDVVAQNVQTAAKTVVDTSSKVIGQAQNVLNDVSENFERAGIKKSIEKYHPIFIDNIPTFYPKMIYIIDQDKRMNIKGIEKAIGFNDNINNVDVLSIYQKNYKKFSGIEYYPDKNPTPSVYYVNPIDKSQYISINEYFKYLSELRIAELENIAKELGAKHFKVQIMELESLQNKKMKKIDASLSAGRDKYGASVDIESKEKAYDYVGIASELSFTGRLEPREPKLNFWANNESIKNLIKQRMSSDNRLQTKTFRLDYNTATGIKGKEAAKIDGVLKILKFSAGGSIQAEAEKENKRKLEYTIDF